MNYAPLMLYIVITCITPGPNNIMCMYLGRTVASGELGSS